MTLAKQARALSVTQRQALLDHPNGAPSLRLGLARSILIYRGLLDYRKRWWIAGPRELTITRKGRRLREHLRTSTPIEQDKAA